MVQLSLSVFTVLQFFFSRNMHTSSNALFVYVLPVLELLQFFVMFDNWFLFWNTFFLLSSQLYLTEYFDWIKLCSTCIVSKRQCFVVNYFDHQWQSIHGTRLETFHESPASEKNNCVYGNVPCALDRDMCGQDIIKGTWQHLVIFTSYQVR